MAAPASLKQENSICNHTDINVGASGYPTDCITISVCVCGGGGGGLTVLFFTL